jgi:DnaK suppressor protein
MIVHCATPQSALLIKIKACSLSQAHHGFLLTQAPTAMTLHLLQPRVHTQLTMMRHQLLARIEQQRDGKVSRAEAANAHFDHVQDDEGQRNNERDVEFAINERETAQLQDIDLALQRLSDKVYGLCINCGTHIAEQRMEAAPLCLRCVTCQTAFETQPSVI